MAGKKLNITSIDADNKSDVQTDDILQAFAPETPENAQSHTKAKNEYAPGNALNNTENAPPSFGWLKVFGIISWLLWVGLMVLFLFVILSVQKNWQELNAIQWAGIVSLVLGSASILFMSGYALKKLAHLSVLAEKLSKNAESLSQPDESVVKKSEIMRDAIIAQIEAVDDKLNASLGKLAHMDEIVKTQTAKLDKASELVRQTSEFVSKNIEQNSEAMANMELGLKQSISNISNLLGEHIDKLETAMQISEQKIKEARISLDGAIAKLNTASDIVRSNTVQAASTLSASHEDIKSLGDIIRLRSDELDEVYKRHGSELTAMIEHLREEQQVLGANMEERLAKMRDLSLSAQASAESLITASKSGKDTIEALAEAAELSDSAIKKRFEDMREMVRYSTEQTRNITEMASARVKDSLELTRREIARIEKDMQEMQNKIDGANTRALELVEEPQKTDQKSDKKRRWTRLKLVPVLDDMEKDTDTKKDNIETSGNAERADIKLPSIEEQEDFHDEILQMAKNNEARTTDSDTVPDIIKDKNQPNDNYTKKQDNKEDTISRPAQDSDIAQKPKRGLFRSIFGKNKKTQSAASASSLDIVSIMGEETAEPQPDIISRLEILGIGANLVVDEGCIIEACNARVARGHLAMSKVVKNRLKGPVEHLTKSMSIDESLQKQAIEFATNFNTTLEHLRGNREAIRNRLETEKGRAYLLCDAALNSQKI